MRGHRPVLWVSMGFGPPKMETHFGTFTIAAVAGAGVLAEEGDVGAYISINEVELIWVSVMACMCGCLAGLTTLAWALAATSARGSWRLIGTPRDVEVGTF